MEIQKDRENQESQLKVYIGQRYLDQAVNIVKLIKKQDDLQYDTFRKYSKDRVKELKCKFDYLMKNSEYLQAQDILRDYIFMCKLIDAVKGDAIVVDFD